MVSRGYRKSTAASVSGALGRCREESGTRAPQRVPRPRNARGLEDDGRSALKSMTAACSTPSAIGFFRRFGLLFDVIHRKLGQTRARH